MVSPSPDGLFAFQPGAKGATARAAATASVPRPQGSGQSQAPPEPPAAVPVRTGLEPTQLPQGEHGRGRRGAPTSAFAAETDGTVPDPLLLLRLLLFLGYRRVRARNLLDHPLRRALVAAISADPGLDIADCTAATGANRETIRYHLTLLVCGEIIVEELRSGSIRYFPRDPTLTPVHRAILHLRRNPALAPTLRHILEAPGISRRELTALLGVTGPSVTRRVQRLAEVGLVESRGSGRSRGYWLTSAAEEAFEAFAEAEVSRDRMGPDSDPST